MDLETINKFIIKRVDFYGYQVKVAANIYPPWFYGYTINNTFVPNAGRAYSFLLFLAEYFNFTWTIINQHDDWGLNPLPNGSYKGMIGSILSGETDFAIGGVSVRFQANKSFIRFSEEVKSTKITFMTLKSEPINYNGTLFKPFGTFIWLSIFMLVSILIVIGFIATKLGKLQFDLHWMLLFSFLQRGCNYHSIPGFSINFLIQLCWWSGMILMLHYSTFIMSTLTDVHRIRDIQGLDQFVNMIKTERVVPLVSGQNTYYGLFSENNDTNDVFSALAKYSIPVQSYQAAISKMILSRLKRRSGLKTKIFSIIAPYDYLELWADRLGPKNFYYRDNIANSIFTDRYALMFRSNSTWIPYFDGCIRLAREHGFFNRWHRIQYQLPFSVDEMKELLLELEIENLDIDDQELQCLGIENLEELFIFFICSLGFNLMLFFLEIALKNDRIRRKIRRFYSGTRTPPPNIERSPYFQPQASTSFDYFTF